MLIDDSLIRMRRLWKGHETRESSPGGDRLSTVLVADAVHRADREGATTAVADVGERLDVTHSTASRLVERAVAAGVVVRSRAPSDQRRVVLRLTADGERLVRRSTEFRADYLRHLLADWSDADVATFAHLLARFAASARPPPDPTGDHR